MNKTLNIAVFGGTFNPVHYGHLINARHIQNEFSLSKVIFVPTRYPVHKELESDVSSGDRFAMLNLAICDNKDFETSRIELDRKSPSYAITTIKEMIRLYEESSLYSVIGADSYNQLATWKDYIQLLSLTRFIVLRRPGSDIDKNKYPGYEDRFHFSGNPLMEISSHAIRDILKSGGSANNLVPDVVSNYINQKGLYRD